MKSTAWLLVVCLLLLHAHPAFAWRNTSAGEGSGLSADALPSMFPITTRAEDIGSEAKSWDQLFVVRPRVQSFGSDPSSENGGTDQVSLMFYDGTLYFRTDTLDTAINVGITSVDYLTAARFVTALQGFRVADNYYYSGSDVDSGIQFTGDKTTYVMRDASEIARFDASGLRVQGTVIANGVTLTDGQLVTGSSATSGLYVSGATATLRSNGVDQLFATPGVATVGNNNGRFVWAGTPELYTANFTIASGVLGYTRPGILARSEGGAATDTLDTLSGQGRLVCIKRGSASEVITVSSAGNIITGGADIVLDNDDDALWLYKPGTYWTVLSFFDADGTIARIPQMSADPSAPSSGAVLYVASDGDAKIRFADGDIVTFATNP